MYIPDPLEILEAQMERQADLLDADDTYPCVKCKRRFLAETMFPVSAHPAAPLMCEECLEEEGVALAEDGKGSPGLLLKEAPKNK